jgi:hypothetical protein
MREVIDQRKFGAGGEIAISMQFYFIAMKLRR